MTTGKYDAALETVISLLNEARCNSKRAVGNRELAQRILEALGLRRKD